MEEVLKRAHEELEERVCDRTAELLKANDSFRRMTRSIVEFTSLARIPVEDHCDRPRGCPLCLGPTTFHWFALATLLNVLASAGRKSICPRRRKDCQGSSFTC